MSPPFVHHCLSKSSALERQVKGVDCSAIWKLRTEGRTEVGQGFWLQYSCTTRCALIRLVIIVPQHFPSSRMPYVFRKDRFRKAFEGKDCSGVYG
jgi:hypothetical protein